MLENYTPKILHMMKGYNFTKLLRDAMAGLSVGIVALPLAIAFGISSGASPETGLIAAIIGGFIASLLGGSSVQITGPSGAFIVIVTSVMAGYGIHGLLLATTMAGVILITMGALRLGTIIKFIPYPIIVGFTSGIAVLLFTSQVPDIFGLNVEVDLPHKFIERWVAVFENVSLIDPVSIITTIITATIIVYSNRLTNAIPGSLIAIVTVTLLALILNDLLGVVEVIRIGDLFDNLNNTIPAPKAVMFDMETVTALLPAAFTLALLCSMETLLSVTVSDGVTGERTNSNVELMSQGVANVIVPLFGGIPVTGAIARTMTNVTNGGRTPIAGIIHSLILLLVLLFLMPLVKYIPMAALAGILAVVAYNMSNWRTCVGLIAAKNSDSLVLLITFILTVAVDITLALELGLVLAALLFMRRISEASSISLLSNKVEDERGDELDLPAEVGVYEIDGPFFFGVANKFEEVMKQSQKSKHQVRIIRMRKVPFIDSTGLHNLELLVARSEKDGIEIVLSGINNDVRETLLTSEIIMARLEKEDICDSISKAITRAKSLVK